MHSQVKNKINNNLSMATNYAINTSALTILPQRSEEIFGKFTAHETVLSNFRPILDVNPGKYLIRYYEGNGSFGDCCTMPDNGGTFGQTEATAVCLKLGFQFCDADLAAALNDLRWRFTAGGEQLPPNLELLFAQQELAKHAINVDRLVFQGDTTSMDNNLNKLDGLIKQITTLSPAANVYTSTQTSIYAVIRELVLKLDPYGYDMGGYDIYVPQEAALAFQDWYINRDYYHYNPGTTDANWESFTLPGYAGIRIIPTRGLNGTNKIVASPRNNYYWLTNVASDHMTYIFKHSDYHDVWYWQLKFILGVSLGIFDYGYVVTFDASALTGQYAIGVDIVSPRNAAGDAVTVENVTAVQP